jgi:DNA invertase Pin-like site-specific DNA recombinase
VRETGARLVSIHEPMVGEDTPEALVMEGWLAVNNEYESMKISRRARLGIHKKASYGGSYGGRRLGYVKCECVVTLPDGRQISDVALDPDRHDFITAAFKLYASETYSIPQLSDELYRLGLRSFRTRAAMPKARSGLLLCSAFCVTPTTPGGSSTSAASRTPRRSRDAIRP